MKNLIVLIVVALTSITASAASINPTNVKLSPDSISDLIHLAKSERDGVFKNVSLVITDNGMSTDVSPRHEVYLTYTSFAEMGNLSATYLIDELVFGEITAKRISAGVYEVTYTGVPSTQDLTLVTITKTIDTTAAFIDDANQRKQCSLNHDFCDGKINAKIKVTTTISK